MGNETNWISILPALLTIALAIGTKRILPSLFLGLLLGGILKAQALLKGFSVAIDSIVSVLSDESNLYVLLFLYVFSGLIGLIRNSGGMKAFRDYLMPFLKTDRSVFYTLWGLLPFTFIDCGFRVIETGSILRPIAEKKGIQSERLAFMLNNTASPAVELIPIATTFIAYNVGIIQQGLKVAGIQQSGYGVLLRAIPLEFFSWAALALTFVSIYLPLKQKGHAKKETSQKHDSNEKHKKMARGMDMDMEMSEFKIKPRMFNFVVPTLLVILFSLLLVFISIFEHRDQYSSFGDAMVAVDPSRAMLLALMLSFVGTSVLYLAQRYPLKDLPEDFLSGGNEIVKTLAILILAWPLAKLSHDLGLGEFVKDSLGTSLPVFLLPVTIFVASSALTYFIGSGWGAAAILMPIAIPLAASLDSSIPLTVAAVITGGTFGDVTSPISGMANMSSNVSRADHMTYIRYASKYNFAAAGIAVLLFLIAGFF